MEIENTNLPGDDERKVEGHGDPEHEEENHKIDETIRRDEMEILAMEEIIEEKREEIHHLEEEKHHEHPQVILVNTKPKEYQEKNISFQAVVLLAYHDATFDGRFTYTVEYCKGPEQNPKGSLIDNEKVFVKNGMEFDVERGDVS